MLRWWGMAERDPPQHITTEEARAGETPHVTRYVLGASLLLVVMVFAWLFLTS